MNTARLMVVTAAAAATVDHLESGCARHLLSLPPLLSSFALLRFDFAKNMIIPAKELSRKSPLALIWRLGLVTR